MAKSGQRGSGPKTAPDGHDAGGALSALLGELARSPEVDGSWNRSLRAGAVIGRFELVRELGRGVGVVWEARDRELGRAVAFKAVRAGKPDGIREERLLREAEAAARLSHPNIVTLYDAGRSDEGPYLVLELLRGEPLADRLSGPHLAARGAADRVGGGGRARARARAGVVHRDLSPGNVFLCEDGQVKVLDFGLAHAFGRRDSTAARRVHGARSSGAARPRTSGPTFRARRRCSTGCSPARCRSRRRRRQGGDGPRPRRLERRTCPRSARSSSGCSRRTPSRGRATAPRSTRRCVAFRRELERTPNPSTAPVRARVTSRRRVAAAAAVLLAVAGVTAVGVQLRARGGAGTASAEERIRVAVADFENQTGEAELNGLSGMLITSLEQSRRLAVLTRVRMLDILRQLGRENVAAVDETLGREVARSAGVARARARTIRRFDELLRHRAEGARPDHERVPVHAEGGGAGKASVPGIIDRLSEQTAPRRCARAPAEVRASRVDGGRRDHLQLRGVLALLPRRAAQGRDPVRPGARRVPQGARGGPVFALAHYRIAYLGEFTGLDAATPHRESRRRWAVAPRPGEGAPAHPRLEGARRPGRRAGPRAVRPRGRGVPAGQGGALHGRRPPLPLGGVRRGAPALRAALALDPLWEPALMHSWTASRSSAGPTAARRERRAGGWSSAPGGSSYRALTLAEIAAGRSRTRSETPAAPSSSTAHLLPRRARRGARARRALPRGGGSS